VGKKKCNLKTRQNDLGYGSFIKNLLVFAIIKDPAAAYHKQQLVNISCHAA
jgi:hypothetical protein